MNSQSDQISLIAKIVRMPLHWQMMIAMALAVAAGLASGVEASLFGMRLYDAYAFGGSLFLNALKMVALPLVATSIICGVASLGGGSDLGRLGGRTILFYLCSSSAAILVGLLLVNWTSPGLIDGQPAGERLNFSRDGETEAMLQAVSGRGGGDVVDVFLRLVPPNVFAALAEGQMLGIIFFSLLFGFFVARIKDTERAAVQRNFWEGALEAVMSVTMLVIRFSPLGVFCLIAKTIAATGFASFVPLLNFFLTVVLALAVHALITLPVVLSAFGLRPTAHFRGMSPALLTAFSTASSSGTLPLTIKCVRDNIGVSNRTSGFVLPLGATINMDGTALYECVAAMFIAQAYGLELSFTTQLIIVITALLTSVGVAGIPSASLVAISIILGAIGLPLEGIALLLVTDRILDMMRTTVNVFSDSCGAAVLAKANGEQLKSARGSNAISSADV